ncbi:MAG: NHLP bacteriocin export ABC transporter permease/ATPase subunit [Chlorobiaceae bacterium]
MPLSWLQTVFTPLSSKQDSSNIISMDKDVRQADPNNPFARRAALKADTQQKEYRSALGRVVSLLQSGGDATLDIVDADPLFAACAAIGKSAGLTFRKPDGDITSSHEDPLQLICRFSGIRARLVTLRKSERWWTLDNGPMLSYSHDNKKPFALLPGVNSGYRLFDPSTSETVEVTPSIAEGIAEQAWMFYRPFPDKPMQGKELLQFGMFGCRGDVIRIILLGIVCSLLGLLPSILTGKLFDEVIPQSDRSQLLQLALILVASIISASGFDLAKSIAATRMQTRIDMHIQPGLIDRLLNLPSNFFRTYSSGDLAMRVLGANQIRDILSSSAVSVILGMLFSIFSLCLLFYYSWKLALVALLLIMIISAATLFVSLRQLAINSDAVTVQGKISGLLGDLLGGITKIRVTGTERAAFSKWAHLFAHERGLLLKAGKLKNTLSVVITSFPVMALAFIIFSVGNFLQNDKLATGSLLAFISAYTGFQTTLIQMVMTVTASLNVVPLYNRLKPILETLPESDTTKKYPGKLTGGVSVQNLNFSYSSDSPQILYDIDFSASPGEFIALVGGSGSGKSTLLRLLLGFEKPDSGTVYYDGEDLAALNVQAVRRQIGVVMQNGQLQPGFILQNIIGSSILTIDDAWEAAKMAGFDEDIRQMPMGMHTVISEGSGTLSGGQKQRLLIAGSLVRKPRIIFFDEATSALDNRTQEVVSSSLEQLQATRIVIAHRLSTIRHADRIYCLDKGRIVQSGTYTELMAQEGFFKELASRQIA